MAETTTAPTKLSAEQVATMLTAISDGVGQLTQYVRLQFNPSALKIHKAKKDGSGVALKLDLRLEPVYDGGYIKRVNGGLFMELVPQAGTNDKGDATFGWEDPRVVAAKLGLPDISSFLTAIESRYANRVVPANMRAKGDEVGATVGMFHVYEAEGKAKSTTAIEYRLAPEGAYLKASKSASQRQQIMLTQGEEMQVRSYLTHALTMFQLVGKR